MSNNNKAFNLDKQSVDSGISCLKIIYFDNLEMVATGDWDGQICFYNIKTYNIGYKLFTPNLDSVTYLNFSKEIDSLFIGTGFGFLYVVNLKQIYQDLKSKMDSNSRMGNYGYGNNSNNNNINGDPQCLYYFGKHELIINGIFHINLIRSINALSYGGNNYGSYNSGYGNNYGGSYNNYNTNNTNSNINMEVIKHINWSHIVVTTAVDGITSFWDLTIPNNNANQNLILSLNTNNVNLLKIVSSDANNEVLINALSGAFIEIYDLSQLPIIIHNKLINNSQSIMEFKPSVLFNSGFLKDVECVKLFKTEYEKGFVISGNSNVTHYDFKLKDLFNLKVDNNLELLSNYSNNIKSRYLSPKEINESQTRSNNSIYSEKNPITNGLFSLNERSKNCLNISLEGISIATLKDRYIVGLNSNHVVTFKFRYDETKTEINAFQFKEEYILSYLDISPDERVIVGCFSNDFYYGELGFEECNHPNKLCILII